MKQFLISLQVQRIGMSKICEITKKSVMKGNNVSHAHNKTRRVFEPNIQNHRFWSEKQKKWVKLKVSKKALRIIDKLGIDKTLEKYKLI